MNQLGKTLVATKDLAAGQSIVADDVVGKVAEPKGILVKDMGKIIGATLARPLDEDESITWDHIVYKS